MLVPYVLGHSMRDLLSRATLSLPSATSLDIIPPPCLSHNALPCTLCRGYVPFANLKARLLYHGNPAYRTLTFWLFIARIQ